MSQISGSQFKLSGETSDESYESTLPSEEDQIEKIKGSKKWGKALRPLLQTIRPSHLLQGGESYGNPSRWQTYIRRRLVTFSPSVLRDWLGMDEVIESTNEGLTNDEGSMEMIGMNWLDKVDNLPASRLLSENKV
ncbi:Hypothetical predicted protein [Olea europaea subsp. europaea]|uniref:Uncharacterized protein n=1 Tax=Olea europaea subsp. europaea TaxID=158383 RepID=A0A8S0T0P3_OLEEU|nr:Hypothetical predicted protein [Olea europaea subsp. europaea]